MANIAKIVDELSTLTVLEIAELKKLLEEKWGVTAAAPMMMAAAPAAGGGAPAAEAKTEFDVVLVSPGEKKIDVIKVIREVVPGLGLKEAKDMSEAPNAKVKEGLSKAEAEEVKKKLEAAGAKVELK